MEYNEALYYVGEHRPCNDQVLVDDVINRANTHGYDFITSHILSPNYYGKLGALVNAAQDADDEARPRDPPQIPALGLADVLIHPTPLISSIVAFTSADSDELSLTSPDPYIQSISKQVLLREVNYASFCGIVTVVVPCPQECYSDKHTAEDGAPSDNVATWQFAQAVKEVLDANAYMHVSIYMPPCGMTYSYGVNPGAKSMRPKWMRDDGKRNAFNAEEMEAESCEQLDTWDVWNTVRTVCKYSSRLSLVLALPPVLPQQAVLNRWFSEPIRGLFMPSSIFVVNAKGFPVLSKPHQQLIWWYMKQRSVPNGPWICLANTTTPPPPALYRLQTPGADIKPSSQDHTEADPTGATSPGHREFRDEPLAYLSYMRFLQRNHPAPTAIERFGNGYQDFLQSPLQPLADNLESGTYEVFEKDPVKYERYQEAIRLALLAPQWERFEPGFDMHLRKSRVGDGGGDFPSLEQSTAEMRIRERITADYAGRKPIRIAVVGAGRGPLVTGALRASMAAGRKVKVYALEKNPNAVIVLERMNMHFWGGKVEIIAGDMRDWDLGATSVEDNDELMNSPRPPPGIKLEPGVPIRIAKDKGKARAYAESTATEVSEGGYEGDHEDIFSAAEEDPSTFDADRLMSKDSDSDNYIDIFVSELLGSFGDNELSPECLDGVQRLLNPNGGIMIPQSYSAHVTPVSTPKLYNLIAHISRDPTEAAETPYVVYLHSFDNLARDAHVHRIWSFSHPIDLPETTAHTAHLNAARTFTDNDHNTRTSTHTFHMPRRGVLHGLAGYFEAVLYDSTAPDAVPVCLSTRPDTQPVYSPDMTSWFPMFFPLCGAGAQGLYVPDGAEVDVRFARRTDGKKVWYEWSAEVWVRSVRGRVKVAGGEVVSSKRVACLM